MLTIKHGKLPELTKEQKISLAKHAELMQRDFIATQEKLKYIGCKSLMQLVKRTHQRKESLKLPATCLQSLLSIAVLKQALLNFTQTNLFAWLRAIAEQVKTHHQTNEPKNTRFKCGLYDAPVLAFAPVAKPYKSDL